MIVIGILSALVGFLLCGIGIYFTVSCSYLVQYEVYKEVIGFDNNATKQIEQHFKTFD